MKHETYAPLVELRSRSEAEQFLNANYPTMPAAVRAVALESFERRLRKANNSNPPTTAELQRRADALADAIRRDEVAAVGEAIHRSDDGSVDDVDEEAILDAWESEFGEDDDLRALGADDAHVYYLAGDDVVRLPYAVDDAGNITFDRGGRAVLSAAEEDAPRSLAGKIAQARADRELQRRARGY